MWNGDTATKSMMMSANSCLGGAAIVNGDGRTQKRWCRKQQMRQPTEEWKAAVKALAGRMDKSDNEEAEQ